MPNHCVLANNWKEIQVKQSSTKRNDSAVAFLYALETFNNLKIGENKMKCETILCKETVAELFNRGIITYNQYCELCQEIRIQEKELQKQAKIKEIERKIEILKNEVENIKRGV